MEHGVFVFPTGHETAEALPTSVGMHIMFSDGKHARLSGFGQEIDAFSRLTSKGALSASLVTPRLTACTNDNYSQQAIGVDYLGPM